MAGSNLIPSSVSGYTVCSWLMTGGAVFVNMIGVCLSLWKDLDRKRSLINPYPDDKILDWPKLKHIADNILKNIQNEK